MRILLINNFSRPKQKKIPNRMETIRDNEQNLPNLSFRFFDGYEYCNNNKIYSSTIVNDTTNM